MLIEFSVANFRSFREKQTFSMVAEPRLHRKENAFQPELEGEKFPSLLKVGVIYGPNASGKSNLLKALSTVLYLTWRLPGNDGPIPISPFIFDSALAKKPSEFEIHFIQKGQRYQFDFAATPERITTERLLAFPKGKQSLLYERKYVDGSEVYEFGSVFKNSVSMELLDAWKKLTPAKILFIAQAVANSSADGAILNEPFNWLKHGTYALLEGMNTMARAARELAAESDSHAGSIAAFLREVDVPIAKIRVEQKVLATDDSVIGLSIPKPRSKISATFLTHSSELGDAEVSYDEESEGTKNLIGFWLPWATRNPSTTANNRRVLIVDEMDSSLHPNVVTALVHKHIHADIPSQLIFTTHDTHLMDAKLLRRDQFWIVERDKNGASKLRSIYDFKGREGEDLEKRYYEGRYRGLPLVSGS